MEAKEKVAVVTGASRGLGAHLAQVLSEEGYALALGARDLASLKSLAEELPGPVFPLALDLADTGSVLNFHAAVQETLGPIEVLVNNAGIGIFKRLEEFSDHEFRKIFAVNVQGAWQMTTAFLNDIKESQGMVVNVSSDVSTRVFPHGGPYCATKFALRALSRTLQMENPDIRVLELRPGAIDTYFANSVPGAEGKDSFLKPKDVAETLRYALALPKHIRLEELVVRSSQQEPEY